VAAIGFGVLVVFQAVLAAGAPLGEAAWGGAEPDLSTAALITRASETDDISLRSDLPLVVIAPAKGRAAARVRADQARLLALSRRSRLVLARDSGHYVHLDQPGLVAAEIEALLRGRRAG
jgi:pimeloyl-ACP methyl ester carboxylesterase